MGKIDDYAIAAAKDEKKLACFIEDQTHFIINCAYRATRKYVSKNDDEWSIALISFSHAVKTYSITKGSFLPYAEKIIKHSLIDYYRSNKKYKSEITVNPVIFESKPEVDLYNLNMKIEVTKKIINQQDTSLTDEIEAANNVFKTFGFSFYSLTKCSPKSKKTKFACKKAILYILNHPTLMERIYQEKRLPLKTIQINTNLPRKLLENHRRYILAAIEILSGEYPHLAEYLSFIRMEET